LNQSWYKENKKTYCWCYCQRLCTQVLCFWHSYS